MIRSIYSSRPSTSRQPPAEPVIPVPSPTTEIVPGSAEAPVSSDEEEEQQSVANDNESEQEPHEDFDDQESEQEHLENLSDHGSGAELDLSNLDSVIEREEIPSSRINKDHPVETIIGNLDKGIQTRHQIAAAENPASMSTESANRACLAAEVTECFLSQIEPKKIDDAILHSSWVEAMQEELQQFAKLGVWHLVPSPKGANVLGTRWVYRVKKDDRGVVVRNKARLVVQGFAQREGLDYDEVFAPVARMESVRIFLAYASFKGFCVYQLDVKTAFLYGQMKVDVYVK